MLTVVRKGVKEEHTYGGELCGTVTPPSADCESSILLVGDLERERGGTTSATLGSLQHRWPHGWSRAENAIPCCNLPKQNTFPLLLLYLLYLNSQIMTTSIPQNIPPKRTVQDLHAQNIFRCSNSQIPQITTCTDLNLRGNVKLQRKSGFDVL